MQIKLDLKIFIFILLFIITGQIEIYGIVMLFAVFHELGHIIAGILVGLRPKSIKITFSGLSVEFETKCEEYNKKVKSTNLITIKKLLIAIAGPLTNFIFVIVYLIFDIKFLWIAREIVIYSNLLIGMFNLIPIYPLDGGRIIKNITNMICGLKDSYKCTYIISNTIVIILTMVTSIIILYIKNLAFLIILAYLWYLVIKENKKYNKIKEIL